MDLLDFFIAEESFGEIYCFNCDVLLLSYADENDLVENTTYTITCPKCGGEKIIQT
jgi:hypothetical protein